MTDETLRKVFVLLPAYNEAASLASLIPSIIRELKSHASFHFVVVDDGSTDETAAVLDTLARDCPLTVLRHEQNLGYGAALRTGFLWIVTHSDPRDLAVSLDSDNTHPPDYILPLIEKLDADHVGVVTASYWAKGGRMLGVPFKRQAMSRIVNGLFSLVTGVQGTRSFTNGFRAYRVAALQKAYERYGDRLIEHFGFPGGTELFLKVASLDVRTAEIPFTLHYERRGADSKIRIVPTILGYLSLLKKAKHFR